jgi:hypothetical protein
MLKKIFLLLLTLCALNCAPHSQTKYNSGALSRVKLVKHLKNSTVALVMETCRIRNSVGECELKLQRIYCSGVWINKSEFLTAHHCVQSYVTRKSTDDEIEKGEDLKLAGKMISFLSKDQVPEGNDTGRVNVQFPKKGTIVSFSSHDDLALVRVDSQYYTDSFVKVSKEKIKVGQEIHVVGHTVGIPFTYSYGHVSGIREHDRTTLSMSNRLVIQVTAPIYFGNSGGGLYTRSGELIGIASYMNIRAPMHLGFFAHRDAIQCFLAKCKKK